MNVDRNWNTAGVTMVCTVRPDENGIYALQRLHKILSGDAEAEWEEPVTALLLHDPSRHDCLDEQVRWLSTTYNRFTGSSLRLFLVNDAREAFSRFGRGGYDERDGLLGWLMRPDPDNDRTPVDTKAFWLQGQAQLFGVEFEHLPGLVIFPSRGENLGSQRRASFIKLPQSDPLKTHALICHVRDKARNFAEGELSEEAFIQSMGMVGWELDPIAGRQGFTGKHWGRWGPTHAPALQLLGGFPNRWNREVSRKEHELLPWIEHSDEATRVTFTTALALWKVFEHDAAYLNHDWGPIIVEFAKGFERSIAMSVIQAARAAHEIEMPEWYGLFKPGQKAWEGKVNLNIPIGRDREVLPEQSVPWRTTMLGESREVYSGCLDHCRIERIVSSTEEPEVLTAWETVGRLRNPVAHYAIDRGETALQMWQVLSSLARMGFPERLSRLRNQMTPVAELPAKKVEVHAHLTIEVPIQVHTEEVQTRHTLSWVRVPDDAPLRILLNLDLASQSIDLDPVPVPLRRPCKEDDLLFGLLCVSVVILKIGELSETARLAAAIKHHQSDRGRRQWEAGERRRRAVKEAVAIAILDLETAIEEPGGFSAVLEKHQTFLAKIRSQASWQREFEGSPNHWERKGLENPSPVQSWQIQTAAIQARRGCAGSAAMDLDALIKATERGEQGPEEALVQAFKLLGLGQPTADLSDNVPRETKRLCGALRYWSAAVASLRAEYGPVGWVAEPYFHLRYLRSIPDFPPESQLRALDPDPQEATGPEVPLQPIEPLRCELSTRFGDLVRQTLAGKPGFQ